MSDSVKDEAATKFVINKLRSLGYTVHLMAAPLQMLSNNRVLKAQAVAWLPSFKFETVFGDNLADPVYMYGVWRRDKHYTVRFTRGSEAV
jgi:hypothetical protein